MQRSTWDWENWPLAIFPHGRAGNENWIKIPRRTKLELVPGWEDWLGWKYSKERGLGMFYWQPEKLWIIHMSGLGLQVLHLQLRVSRQGEPSACVTTFPKVKSLKRLVWCYSWEVHLAVSDTARVNMGLSTARNSADRAQRFTNVQFVEILAQ